jgi:hypothetical protein
LTTPALVASAKGGVAVSLLVPRDDVDLLQIALQHELFMSLRHRRGLIYDVGTFTTPVDGDLSELVFVIDPAHKHVDTAVRVVAQTFTQIAAAGFSEAAVDGARIHGGARAHRTFVGLDYLDRLAADGLHGWPTRSPEQMDEDASGVTSKSLTSVFIGSAASAIIAYNENTTLSKKTLQRVALRVTRLTPWQPVEDDFLPSDVRTTDSTWHSRDGKNTLLVTDKAVFNTEAAHTRRILFADIVLAGDRPCGCLALVDCRGQSIEFQADNWKRLKSLKRHLLEILDPALVRTFPTH